MILKAACGRSDTQHMIFSAHPAPNPAGGELASLRHGLNTPVVAISELSVGPASAAIAVQDDAHGGPLHVTVAVRCQRTAETVFFTARDEGAVPDASMAGETALSLAESMGFLFDEELVSAPAPDQGSGADEVWAEFIANAVLEPVEPEAPPMALSSALPLSKFRRGSMRDRDASPESSSPGGME